MTYYHSADTQGQVLVPVSTKPSQRPLKRERSIELAPISITIYPPIFPLNATQSSEMKGIKKRGTKALAILCNYNGNALEVRAQNLHFYSGRKLTCHRL